MLSISKKHPRLILFTFFILLMINSCTEQEAETQTTLLPIDSDTKVGKNPTPEDLNLENICTDVGCSSGIFINIKGYSPPKYIVVAGDGDNIKIAMQCLEQSSENPFPITHEDFFLNNPKIKDLSGEIGKEIKSYCSKNQPSVMKVWKQNDGSLESIIIECGAEFIKDTASLFSRCSRNSNHIFISGFTPDELSLGIYSDKEQSTIKLKPNYHRYQPNGPNCEPTCLTNTIEISLP